jgi:F-type H+-transporting ATPase subunit delta
LKSNKLAAIYARALFESAKDLHKEDRVKKSMDFILNLLNDNKDLYNILTSPVISYSDKITLINESKICELIESLFYNFLLLLIEKNRFNILYEISFLYNELYFDDKKIISAFVTFATKPDELVLKELGTQLQKITGFDFILNSGINTELIGGFKVVFKDKLIDMSIKRTLLELNEKILGAI